METARKFNPHHGEHGQFTSGERFHDINETPLPGTAGHRSLEHMLGGEPKQVVADVPLEEIHTTQQFIDTHKVAKMLKASEEDLQKASLPIIIELHGSKYLLDGHHRLAMAAVRGEKTLKSRLIWVAPKGTDSKGNVVKKSGDDQRLVWGEVYAPLRPDVDGEYMTAEDVQHVAYTFMRNLRQKHIDVQHDNKIVKGCTIVESFIAREGDPDFIPGSWVVCAHVDDDATWDKIKKGDLNGFSVEALVEKIEKDVTVDVPDSVTGQTTSSDGHKHTFKLTYGPDGRLTGGSTDLVAGHMHQIRGGTITEEANGHRHRFSSVDQLRMKES